MRTTLTGVTSTFIIKAGLDGIRSGDVFSIKIIDNKKGLIKASVRGKTVILKGGPDLKPGELIKVKAQWSGKTLLLNRLGNRAQAGSVFQGSQIESSAAFLMYESAKRAGIHLKDDNIRLIKRFLKGRKKLSPEEARIGAESIKKGIAPDDMMGVSGRGERFYAKDDEDKTLLFNHLTDKNDIWIIVPYDFKIDEESMCGSLRIKKDIKKKQITDLVIETEFSGRRLYFVVSDYNRDAGRKIRLACDGELSRSVKKRIKNALPEILGNLPFKFDDNIIENCFGELSAEDEQFDGFTISRPAAGVEEIV